MQQFGILPGPESNRIKDHGDWLSQAQRYYSGRQLLPTNRMIIGILAKLRNHMAENQTGYEVTYSESNHIDKIVKCYGETREEVKVDPQSQDYCDFLTWWAEDMSRVNVAMTMDKCVFFAEPSKLASYCKERGLLLFAGSDGLKLLRGFPGQHNVLGDYFDRLTTASLIPSDSPTTYVESARYSLLDACISEKAKRRFDDEIANEDSELRKYTTVPIDRSFSYIDISDYSKFTSLEQVRVIKDLVDMSDYVEQLLGLFGRLPGGIEAKLCLGDGYIFVFKSVIEAVLFSAQLANLIEIAVATKKVAVPMHFRMGVHVGSVYFFFDPGRKDWNYCGDGINGGSRVLQAIEKEKDDVVFISGQARNRLIEMASNNTDFHLWSIINSLVNRGRRNDKHGNPWRVYEFNHTMSDWKDHLKNYQPKHGLVKMSYGNWFL